MSDAALPAVVEDEAHLEELLARPSAADVAFARTLSDDVLVLGAGGKMGPSLARRVRRAVDAAGVSRRVFAARASPIPSLARRSRTRRDRDPLLRPSRPGPGRAPASRPERPVPRRPQVRLHRSARPHLGPQHDRCPRLVARRFAGSRIVVFSTGNVYPLVGSSSSGLDGERPARAGRGVRAVVPRPRAGVRVLLARGRDAMPAAPPSLRGRPALRDPRRHRPHRPRGRGGRPAGAAGQRDLAGRRQLVRFPRVSPSARRRLVRSW